MNEIVKVTGSHSLWLKSEIERLDTLLKPAARSQLAERMKVLFAAMPSQDKGASEDLRAQAYLFALEGVPLHVLDAVVRDVLQGRLPGINPAFAPTPPQLAKASRDRIDDMRAERIRRASELAAEISAARIPPPKQLTPEEEDAELKRRAEKADRASAMLAAAIDHMDVTPKKGRAA